VLLEIEDVLSRPKLRRVNPRLTDRRVQDLLARLNDRAIRPVNIPAMLHLPRDPKDEKYLNLAIAGGAGYLVSWDKHLLELRTEDSPEARDFRASYPSLRIVTPVEFLEAISMPVR
jgi:predicted nucleic acid-binding protein